MLQTLIGSVTKYKKLYYDDNGRISEHQKNKQQNMAPKTKDPLPFYSSLGIKYPTLRDHPVKSAANWLKGKQADDGAEGLWRIHDQLYDLTDFIDKHPGGADWLILTKGTDITEAFEVHHLSTGPENMLPKFHVRAAKTTRNSPFTFKEDGFYRTLKKNVRPLLKSLPESAVSTTKLYTDSLFISTFVFAYLATYTNSYIFAVLAAISLCCTAVASHNFFHQKDNLRMYYFDLTALQSREWRVSHALSHHLYTNTIKDLELSVFEPWFVWLPQGKSFAKGYISWIYSPFMYTSIFFASYFRRINAIINDKDGWHEPRVADLIPYALPTFLYIFSGTSLLNVLFWWTLILAISSFVFGLIGLNAAHHHPEIFHDGDAARPETERDWGICQLDTVIDRTEITGNHFLVLTSFGDHGLHHIFPTLDHGKLNSLYPMFKKTCEEFGVNLRMKSQLEMFVGQFQQLIKNTPNPIPPGKGKSK